MQFLISGGSGYFGGVLKRALLNEGHRCINIDIDQDHDRHPNLISIKGDISNIAVVHNAFEQYGKIDAVYHAAAQLQLTRANKKLFFATNIDSTRILAESCVQYGTSNFIFISSNCVYGKVDSTNVMEDEPCRPFEEYGKTKVASEDILKSYQNALNTIIFRPPTIIGEGRLGILAIVFDFIRENRKIWLVGSGENRYQFIYTNDLVEACKLAMNYKKSAVFNIGCDDVPTLNQLFQGVIDRGHSTSKIYHLPAALFLPAMKLTHKLGLSPLGPYQYNMIANTYIGNTNAIKQELNWQPTKSNIAMLADNYDYYVANHNKIINDATLTGHRKVGRAGIINLIKIFS